MKTRLWLVDLDVPGGRDAVKGSCTFSVPEGALEEEATSEGKGEAPKREAADKERAVAAEKEEQQPHAR